MKGRPSSGWHPGSVVVVCSGRRGSVPQYDGHDDVPEIPRGYLVTHPLQGERRGAQLPESLPPTISRVDAGMVGNAPGEVGSAIEDACCDRTYGRLVEGSRARKRTLAFDYIVDHGGPI